MDLALSLREAGRYKEAIAALQDESAAGKALLAQLLSLDGQDDEAWSVLRTAQATDPDCPTVRRMHARLLLKSGQRDAALVEAEAAFRAMPRDAESAMVFASTLASNGRAEARALVEQTLQLRPRYAEAIALRGMLQGNPDDLRAALDLKPHLTHLWEPLATLYHRAGKLDEAKAAYLHAIQAKPQPSLHVDVGTILVGEGSLAEALHHFDRAIELNPGLATAHSNRGKALKDLRRFDDAEAACRYAIGLDPQLAPAHSNLAAVLFKTGRLEEARLAATMALALKPDFAEAQYFLASTLYYSDDMDAAREAFWKTYQMAPTGVGLFALVALACFAFADDDLVHCRNMLQASAQVLARSDRAYKGSNTYWRYLKELLGHPQCLGTAAALLHVVGDSHSLSASGVVVNVDGQALRGVPTLIMGCKQWHLASDEPNEFKVKFVKVMARLAGPILLTIGEIDCRPNEGVFAHWRSNPGKSLEDIIDRTVSGYIKCIDRPVIVSGIPAPVEGEPIFVDCVRRFNDCLRERTLSRGLRFLDVHSMTDNGYGLSNGRWHLDRNHLTPDAIREAFSKHLL